MYLILIMHVFDLDFLEHIENFNMRNMINFDLIFFCHVLVRWNDQEPDDSSFKRHKIKGHMLKVNLCLSSVQFDTTFYIWSGELDEALLITFDGLWFVIVDFYSLASSYFNI